MKKFIGMLGIAIGITTEKSITLNKKVTKKGLLREIFRLMNSFENGDKEYLDYISITTTLADSTIRRQTPFRPVVRKYPAAAIRDAVRRFVDNVFKN